MNKTRGMLSAMALGAAMTLAAGAHAQDAKPAGAAAAPAPTGSAAATQKAPTTKEKTGDTQSPTATTAAPAKPAGAGASAAPAGAKPMAPAGSAMKGNMAGNGLTNTKVQVTGMVHVMGEKKAEANKPAMEKKEAKPETKAEEKNEKVMIRVTDAKGADGKDLPALKGRTLIVSGKHEDLEKQNNKSVTVKGTVNNNQLAAESVEAAAPKANAPMKPMAPATGTKPATAPAGTKPAMSPAAPAAPKASTPPAPSTAPTTPPSAPSQAPATAPSAPSPNTK